MNDLSKDHNLIITNINPNFIINSRFKGGMSNYTYMVLDKVNNKYVFRIPGENGENFVDYKQEAKNLLIISQLHISNEVVFFDGNSGIKVSRYIEGNKPNIENIDRIAKVIKDLHKSELKLTNDYNLIKRINKYNNLIVNDSLKYKELYSEFLGIHNKYLKKHCHYPCHNDIQLNNLVINKEIVKILDWEFAGMNDYIYDIASFGGGDFSNAIKLLESYNKNYNKDHLIRLYGWRIGQCLQWYNVALFKDNVGLSKKLEIDFALVSDKYLKEAECLLNSLKDLIISE